MNRLLGERIVVAINPSSAPAQCPLDRNPGRALRTIGAATADWTAGTLTVPPSSATIFPS